jgi:hypothetical protein
MPGTLNPGKVPYALGYIDVPVILLPSFYKSFIRIINVVRPKLKKLELDQGIKIPVRSFFYGNAGNVFVIHISKQPGM